MRWSVRYDRVKYVHDTHERPIKLNAISYVIASNQTVDPLNLSNRWNVSNTQLQISKYISFTCICTYSICELCYFVHTSREILILFWMN